MSATPIEIHLHLEDNTTTDHVAQTIAVVVGEQDGEGKLHVQVEGGGFRADSIGALIVAELLEDTARAIKHELGLEQGQAYELNTTKGMVDPRPLSGDAAAARHISDYTTPQHVRDARAARAEARRPRFDPQPRGGKR